MYTNIVSYFLHIFFYSKRFYLFPSVISDSRWKLYDRGNCYKSSADTAGLMTPGTADQRTGNENEARRILWRGWKIEQLQMHLQLVKKRIMMLFFEILDTLVIESVLKKIPIIIFYFQTN